MACGVEDVNRIAHKKIDSNEVAFSFSFVAGTGSACGRQARTCVRLLADMSPRATMVIVVLE